MAQRTIRPGATLIVDPEETKHEYPTDRPVIQYIRQSSDGQVKKNKQSTRLQDEGLSHLLTRRGFKTIIKIDEDQGKSGQKRRDERTGLDRLLRMIEKREAGAVAAYDASRLYRDLTRVHYTQFVATCEQFHIPVITYSRTYWPDSVDDMDALIEEFKRAAKYIEEQIQNKLIPAKMQAIELGMSYGGHAVPLGFIIAETEDRKYYEVYEPQARLIRWLFRRYRELCGNLPRLGRELRDTGFKFPVFEGVPIPHISLPFVDGGYVVRTRGALVSILTNYAYIGWYAYNGVVVSREAHTAIVSIDDFMYAYDRLSNVTLDGEDREEKPKVERRYSRVSGLLEGILESNGQSAHIDSSSKSYRIESGDDWNKPTLRAHVADIDTAFSEALIRLLAALELRHQQGLQDSLHEQLAQLQEEKHEEGISLDTALANVEKAIRQAEMDKRIALEEEYESGVREATRQLKRLHADKVALEAKAEQADSEEAELAECQDLLECAITRWDSLPFDRQQRFVRLVACRADIVEVSPHILRLSVALKDPVNCMLVGYIYRHPGTKTDWTGKELETLKALYPRADRKEILKALPERSWDSILKQAGIMGLNRPRNVVNSCLFPEYLTHADVSTMHELGYAFIEQSRRFVSYGHESPWFAECDGIRTSIDQIASRGMFVGSTSSAYQAASIRYWIAELRAVLD